MASSVQYLLLLVLFIASSSSSSSFAKSSFRPKALVIPITKDDSTLQYVTQIHQRTPLVPIKLVVDLGGQFLWVDCEENYASSTYRPARCKSAQCHLAGISDCGFNNSCSVILGNTVTHHSTIGDIGQDVVSVQSTNGFIPGRNVAVPRFIFSCGYTSLLRGLADGVSGVAGLGRAKIGFPSQFASAFSIPRKFAICLSPHSKGVVIFGDGPYGFLPNVNAAQSLTYTPLILNRPKTDFAASLAEALAEYYIGVKSIKIDQNVVPNINKTLLSIDKKGYGGTKISTLDPYTVLEKSIFKTVTEAFIKASAARNITRVAGVAPFEVCFSKHNVGNTRLGAAVPTIELVLQNKVSWPILGANSMVPVKKDVLCLGVVNKGDNSWNTGSIVIGGYQLENNLLQFDLASSRLGFSSLLFGRRTTCANFNFTSAA